MTFLDLKESILTVDFKSAARFINAVEDGLDKSFVKVSLGDLKVSCFITVCSAVVLVVDLVVVVVVVVADVFVVALLATDVPGFAVAAPVVVFVGDNAVVVSLPVGVAAMLVVEVFVDVTAVSVAASVVVMFVVEF